MNHSISKGSWTGSIFLPGHNAWRVEEADSLKFLIDGDAYFQALAGAIGRARRSIRIVGWDFHPDIPLGPLGAPRLGELLRRRVEEEPALEVFILVWAMAPIYAGGTLKLLGQEDWNNHPRIHLRLDSRHALRGSHHQKLVSIDDVLAFAGGIDLTTGRWDTPDHSAHTAIRQTPDGQKYGPVHDVQLMMSGPAGRALSELCRWRWEMAVGEAVPEVWTPEDPWPEEIQPDLAGSRTAISRTLPDLSGITPREEAIRLTHDAIALAKHHIYIETQYLASFAVANSLAKRLRETEGPEVVILVTSSSRGAIEQFVMARNRNRLIRRLKMADRHGRLRILYAVTPDEQGQDCEVLIHAKVMVVDDRFARVGSSNLNNRSEGLDTECDIGIEARSEADARAIALFRNTLLAEHVAASVEEVERELASGTLVQAIDRLNVKPRGLRPFEVDLGRGITQLPGTLFLDPKRPFRPIRDLRDKIAAAFTSFRRSAF